MDATENVGPLEQLEHELRKRGWNVNPVRDGLKVANPDVPTLNDTVTVTKTEFVYGWGPSLGLLTDVNGVADRLTSALRTVGQEFTP